MKIRPVGAELFHADRRTDGRTDMTKLRVAFRNFAYAPKLQCLTTLFFSDSTQKHYVSWGAHSGIAEDSGILGCYSAPTDELPWTFLRKLGLRIVRRRQRLNSAHPRRQFFHSQTCLLPSITLLSNSQRHSAMSRLRRRKWNPDVKGSVLIQTNLVLRLLALRTLAEITWVAYLYTQTLFYAFLL
jgi:hypothetical protein